MNIINENELREVSKEYIDNTFVMDGQEIFVLNNSLFNGLIDEDALILCKGEEKNGELVLCRLSEQEYAQAYKRYYMLLEAFKEGENE